MPLRFFNINYLDDYQLCSTNCGSCSPQYQAFVNQQTQPKSLREEVPTVRLTVREGVLYSLDNRRLYPFQQAGVPMPFRMATNAEVASAVSRGKFTNLINGGKTIRISPLR